MTEHVVAEVDAFPPGARHIVRHGRLEIGVFNVAGTYYALPNVCVHQYGPLCEGIVTGTLAREREDGWQLRWVREGEILACPWHGMEYDITTGYCLAFPKRKLRQFPVVVQDGRVVVVV